MERDNPPNSIIASVDRALELLLLLQDYPQGLGVSEIARRLGIYKSTIHRTLITLQNRGFVTKKNDGSYCLGMTVCALGLSVRERAVYLDELATVAKSLCTRWKENINVSIPELKDGTYRSLLVHREVHGENVLQESQRIGGYTDCHVSSVGKCMLAFLPNVTKEYVNGLNLCKFTENTITSPEKLWEELERIKRRGYAVDNEEREIGLFCIGVPIFNYRHEVVAAISISGVADRIKRLDRQSLINDLLQVSIKTRVFC